MNNEELKQFIYNASRATYASGDESLQERQSDGSTTIRFSEGIYAYHDNYFGGEPYGGREVVFYDGKPIWMMVYYGAVSGAPKLDVYTFLMKALSQSTLDMPYRGPEKYTDEMWLYENSLTGDIERFSGTEKIYYHGLCVYRADYIGGFIDRY